MSYDKNLDFHLLLDFFLFIYFLYFAPVGTKLW